MLAELELPFVAKGQQALVAAGLYLDQYAQELLLSFYIISFMQ